MLPALVISSLILAGRSSGHGAYHDVVEALSAELRQNPNDAALRYKLAEAHAGHEEWRACNQELKLVERLAPGIYPSNFLRGLALHIVGREEEAKEMLDVFLTESPRHVDALATRGKVLVRLGRLSEAAADLQQAVDLSPVPLPEIIVELATCYARIGKNDEAGKTIDAGVEAAGEVPSLLLCALEIETKAGAWDDALRRIDALQRTSPRPERWMAQRAALLTKAGRADEARVTWIALRDHLLSLPNLDRGSPLNQELLKQSREALGEVVSQPVIAPPAPRKL